MRDRQKRGRGEKEKEKVGEREGERVIVPAAAKEKELMARPIAWPNFIAKSERLNKNASSLLPG